MILAHILVWSFGALLIFLGLYVWLLLLSIAKENVEYLSYAIRINTKKGIIYLPGKVVSSIIVYSINILFLLIYIIAVLGCLGTVINGKLL